MLDGNKFGLEVLLEVIGLVAWKSQLGFVMRVCLRWKQSETLTPSDLLEIYSNLIWQLSSKLQEKKKREENPMFSFYSATKEKPYAPIFHIVKGRNNYFLFGMQFSASLWWNADSWESRKAVPVPY